MHSDVLGDSWLEFVLDPSKLDSHLEAIKTGKAVNPTGLVLIKTFVKQAEKPSTTSAQAKREKLLNGLAAKVWNTLGITLDEIEKAVPTKYQRQLLAELVSTFNTPVVNSTLHRWVLRAAIHGVDPDVVRYDAEQSIQFLKNWISTVQNVEEADAVVKNQFLSTNFDIGEYLLYGGDFSAAEGYLKKTQELLKSASFKDSIGVINESRLHGLLLASNLPSSTDTSTKLVQTERACALPDQWSTLPNKGMLETDNGELPWAYRWNLDSHTTKRIQLTNRYRSSFTILDIPYSLASQIYCLNAVRHGSQGDLGLVPNWQQKVNFNDKGTADFFFKSCANAVSKKGSVTHEDVLARRMLALATRVCTMVDTVQVWESFVENGFHSDSTTRQLLVQKDLGSKQARAAVSQHAQPQSSPSSHLQKVMQYARDRQFLHKIDATVTPEQLFAKARECFDAGDYAQAKRIYQSNQNPNFTTKSTYGVFVVDLALYIQQHIPQTHQYNPHPHQLQQQPPLHQESYVALLDQLHKCLSLGIPDAFSFQHTNNWVVLQKVVTDTKQKLEESNQFSSETLIMCDLGLGIAEIMLAVSSFTENQAQTQMIRALDPPLTRHFPIILSYPGVLYALLGELRYPTCPSVLASICAGLIHTMQKSKPNTTNPPPQNTLNTDIALERYGTVAEIAALCKCKSISVTMDTQIVETMQQLLIRLQTICPSHIWLAGLADTLFEQARFREAIEFYLLAISTDSFWFVGLKLGAHMYGMLSRLVSCLVSIKSTAPAVALLQLVPNGYAVASRIIQEDLYALDASYFQFIWDVSFLELLIFVYNRAKDDKKTNYLTQMLGVPELNEYNPAEMRQAFIHHIKLNLFKTLYVDFLT